MLGNPYNKIRIIGQNLIRWDGIYGRMDLSGGKLIGDIEVFVSIFKARLKDMFLQDWHSRLEVSTRAQFDITIANSNIIPI